MTQPADPTRNEFATGESKLSSDEVENVKILSYPFGPYEILLKLSTDGVFKEIIEVRVNKDFLSYSQKIASTGHHDVEQFYDKE